MSAPTTPKILREDDLLPTDRFVTVPDPRAEQRERAIWANFAAMAVSGFAVYADATERSQVEELVATAALVADMMTDEFRRRYPDAVPPKSA